LACPPDSPIRAAGTLLERLDWQKPDKTSFVGLDHTEAMDVCYHPDKQPLHGFTAWSVLLSSRSCLCLARQA